MRRLALLLALALLLCAPVMAAPYTCPDIIDTLDVGGKADAECYYIDKDGSDAADCDVGTPCQTPNHVINTYMTTMTESDSASCSGTECASKWLVANPGVWIVSVHDTGTYHIARADLDTFTASGTTYDQDGAVFLFDNTSCTNCGVIPADYDGVQPTHADEAMELFQDMDDDGDIQFEPSVIFYVEDHNFQYKQPTKPPGGQEYVESYNGSVYTKDWNGWEDVCVAITGGTIRIHGIAFLCPIPWAIDGGSNHDISGNLFWRNTHMDRVQARIETADGTDLKYNAVVEANMQPWSYDHSVSDSSPAGLFHLNSTDDATIEGNYFYGGHSGWYVTNGNNIDILRNKLLAVSTHANQMDGSVDVKLENNIIGGQAYGRCANLDLVCVSHDGEGTWDADDMVNTRNNATDFSTGYNSCTDTPDGTPVDRNNDGIDDEDCSGTTECPNGDTYCYCQPDPWAISPKLCLADSDCTGIEENDTFPSSTTQFGGDTIPTSLSITSNWAVSGKKSDECWHSAEICPTRDYAEDSNYNGLDSGGEPVMYCGAKVDPDSHDGDLDWGGIADCDGGSCCGNIDSGWCDSNLSNSCTVDSNCIGASPRGTLQRFLRLFELSTCSVSQGCEDDIYFLNNTFAGYGWNGDSLHYLRSAWSPTVACSNGEADCTFSGLFMYNNIYADLNHYHGDVSFFAQFPDFTDGVHENHFATNWDIDEMVMFGPKHDFSKYERPSDYGAGTSDWRGSKIWYGWDGNACSGANDPDVGCSGNGVLSPHTAFFNSSDTAGICGNEADTDSATGTCYSKSVSCTTRNCATDANCSANTTTYDDCIGSASGDSLQEQAGWCDNCSYSISFLEFEDYENNNLMPSAGSTLLLNQGRSASFASSLSGTISMPTVDYFGNARDGSPDIGAVEKSAGSATLEGVTLDGVTVD